MSSSPSARWRNIDLWTALALIGVAAYAALQALSFDAGSRPFPLVVATVLGLAAVMQLVLSLREDPKAPLGSADLLPAGACIALMAGWATALSMGLGFGLSTFVAQLGFLALAGMRQPVKIAGVALLITAVSYTIFVLLLEVRLPRSMLQAIAPGL